MDLLDVQTNFDKILDVLKLWGSIGITVTGLVMAIKVIAKEISFRQKEEEGRKKQDDKLITDVAQLGKDIQEIRITIETNRGDIAANRESILLLQTQLNTMNGHYQNLLNDLINRHKTTRNR